MIDPTGKELLAQDSYEVKTIKKLAEEICDLGTVEKVYEIFGGYVNRSFGIEMIGKDGEPIDYFVRRYRDTQSEADIIAEHELIAYIIEKGLDIAAGLIKMPDGKTFTWIENEEDGKNYPWAVYKYLYGEDPYDWINQRLTPPEDQAMGRMQARLHNCAYGFEGGEKEEPQIYEFLKSGQEYWKTCCEGKGVPERDRYHMCYLENIDYVLEMADKARKGMEDAGFIGKGLKTVCHCDYHPSNVKWKDCDIIGMFDFDWSKVDYRLFDICFGLVYTCTCWDAMHDGELDLERCKYYLAGYNEIDDVLPKFLDEEKKAFPYMYLGAMIYLWNWATDYYNFPEDYDEYEWYYYLAHIIKGIHFAEDHIDDLYELICSL